MKNTKNYGSTRQNYRRFFYLPSVIALFGMLSLFLCQPSAHMQYGDPASQVIQADGLKEAAPRDSGQSHSRQEGLAAALNPDGSLRVGTGGSFDTSGYRMEMTATGAPRFVQAPSACSGWDTQFSLPNGVHGRVHALAVSGTDIYVGGEFSLAGSVAANRVAKFDTLTGVWSALGTGGGNGVSNTVRALAVSGSDLYVGGLFFTANVGGTTVAANLVAKVNTTTGVWSALGTGGGNGVSSTGVNGGVFALAVSGSDLYVGGGIMTANVGGPTLSVNNVAKFNTTTGVWSALGTGGGNGVNDTVVQTPPVDALAVSGSDLYVGGLFTTANVGGTTVSVSRVAKVNTTTGVWSALGSGGGNGVNDTVAALAVSGTDIYVGGFFSTVNVGGTTVTTNFLAKFNKTTGVWSALGTGGGNGMNNDVHALAVSGSDLYVGGLFTTAGSVAANRVAKFDTLTGVWSALGTSGGNGVSGSVDALAVSGSDLYVGGAFTTANVGGTTVSVTRVAKFDTLTNTWSALGTGGGNGVSGSVRALAVSGSDLYVGGFFTTANVGGTTLSVNKVAKVNTTTGVWSALGTGGGNGVNSTAFGIPALAVSGSDLYVGGLFTTANVGGTTVSANGVAKFNTTTGVWSALGTGGGNGVDGLVNALAVSGNDLYVGGGFTTVNVGGTTVSVNNIAKVNTTTGTWNNFADTGGGNGVNDNVAALAVSGSDLYVGGLFTVAGDSKPSVNIGRFCTNTSPTPTPRVRADFDGDGKTDVSVYRNSEGNWYLNRSRDGFTALHWGAAGGTDTLVPGDYDNDGKTDLAIFRPDSNPANPDYWVLNSNGFTFTGVSWGLPGDIPVSGDYDSDGKTDFAVFRPSNGTWYIIYSSGIGPQIQQFGQLGDIPLAMDPDGDGKTNLAVFRPANNTWYIARSTGVPAQNFDSIQFGQSGDKLVPADYDGDGKDDIAVFRPSNGTWYIISTKFPGTVNFIKFGQAGDIPVPGDYDGDGTIDIGVYRGGVWYISRSSSTNGSVDYIQFGVATDKPIPAAFTRDVP